MLKRIKLPKDTLSGINSTNDKVFKKGYEKLKESCEFAEKNFKGTAIHEQFRESLKKYAPRYSGLNVPKY